MCFTEIVTVTILQYPTNSSTIFILYLAWHGIFYKYFFFEFCQKLMAMM